jgi:hypothetical protein
MFSADGENLEVMPKELALIRAPWLLLFQGNEPDGTEMTIVDDAYCLAPIFNDPSAKPIPKFILLPPVGWANWDKDVYWTPGSGYNACLGNLRLKRSTCIYSVAVALPEIF